MVLKVVGSNGQKCPIVFIGAGEWVNADIYQDLLRQHVVPMIQRTYLDGIYVFQQDLAPVYHRPNHPEVLQRNHGGFLKPSGLASIFTGPEPAGLFYLERFEGEYPGEASHQSGPLCQSITRQWNRVSLAYIHQTFHPFHRGLKAVMAENGSYIE
jgi:hypothetical protein